MANRLFAPVIGLRIKEERMRQGLSRDQLAMMLGVTPQAVAKWESGKGAPSQARLEKVGAVLGIESFFDGDMSEPSYDSKMLAMTDEDFQLFSQLDEICPEITNEALHILFEFAKFLKLTHRRKRYK